MATPKDAAPNWGVRVDLAGLVDLARAIRQGNESTLQPQSDFVRSDLLYGVCFGATSASGYVTGARQQYHAALLRALEQMRAHIRAAELLADAAERVALNYAGVDALATARVADVERALLEARHARLGVTAQPPPQLAKQ